MSSSSRRNILVASNGISPLIFWQNINYPPTLLSKCPSTRVNFVYVPTASMYIDPDSPSERSIGQRRQRQRANMRKKLARIVKELETNRDDSCEPSLSNGAIDAKFVDVADPKTSSTDACEAICHWADCVYLEGGNTFYLAWHMRRLGIDLAIKEMISSETDGVRREAENDRERHLGPSLIVGISAGAIVLGKSLATALWKGWDKPIPEIDVDDLTSPTMAGLNLCGDRSFFPHYETDKWEVLIQDRAGDLGHRCIVLDEQKTNENGICDQGTHHYYACVSTTRSEDGEIPGLRWLE